MYKQNATPELKKKSERHAILNAMHAYLIVLENFEFTNCLGSFNAFENYNTLTIDEYTNMRRENR